MAGEEQLPVVCQRCGSPMGQAPSGPLHAPIQMRCAQCGAEESLSADASTRIQTLRARWAAVHQLRASADAGLLRAAHVTQAWEGPQTLVAGGVLFCVALAFGVNSAVSALEYVRQNPASQGSLQFLQIAWFAPAPAAAILGAAAGYLALKKSMQEEVVPALRPLPSVGAGLRCRVCGGTLPAATSAFVMCSYCRSENLLGKEAAAATVIALDRAARHAHTQMQQQSSRATEPLEAFQRQWVRAALAAYVLGLAALGCVCVLSGLG